MGKGIVVPLNGSYKLKRAVSPDDYLESVTVERFVDDLQEKRVVAKVTELQANVVLWRDDDYDIIGDWTQKQALKQLRKAILYRYVLPEPSE